jgi:hypothetical protein
MSLYVEFPAGETAISLGADGKRDTTGVELVHCRNSEAGRKSGAIVIQPTLAKGHLHRCFVGIAADPDTLDIIGDYLKNEATNIRADRTRRGDWRCDELGQAICGDPRCTALSRCKWEV